MSTFRRRSGASTAPNPSVNRLIAALPRNDRARLCAAGKSVELAFSEVLREPGARIRHVYFPSEGFISDIAVAGDYATLEVGLTGHEGMCGIAVALGVNVSAQRALVQGAGWALRVGAAAFRREMKRSPALRRILDRYAFVLMTQLAQNALCINSHRIEQRLARWLLMSQDRACMDAFHVTHAFLANMLGIRREGVTDAAGKLQKKNLIRYKRGWVEVMNRSGLEAAACSCYRLDRDTWQRLLG